jgi:hypothetical protein
MRCLEKRPEERFGSLDEFLVALTAGTLPAVLASEPPLLRQREVPAPSQATPREGQVPARLLRVAVLSSCGALAFWVISELVGSVTPSVPPRPQPPTMSKARSAETVRAVKSAARELSKARELVAGPALMPVPSHPMPGRSGARPTSARANVRPGRALQDARPLASSAAPRRDIVDPWAP